MRWSSRVLIVVGLLSAACSEGETQRPESDAADVRQAPAASGGGDDAGEAMGTNADSNADAAADTDAAPKDGDDEDEVKLAAPDGTPMLACGDGPADMACIPGGPFIRGSDEGPENSRPRADVWVQTFWMDRNEVTYAQYKACEKAGACPHSGPQYVDFDRPQQPINGIQWFHARDYCAAQGKRLPTEAEWEKAARGTDGRLYPWGDERATCERAIIMGAEGRGCGLKKKGDKPDTGRPWEVGSRPPNQYGLYDMAGNSWEWVADWYTRSYEECGEACLGLDPKGPCDGADECPGYKHKIVRGGSWYWNADYATTIYRRAHVPENQPFHHFGFRCAGDLDQAARIVKLQAAEQELGAAAGSEP